GPLGFIPNFGRLGSWNVIMFLTFDQLLRICNFADGVFNIRGNSFHIRIFCRQCLLEACCAPHRSM
ncbi:hypothetical protein ABKV19_026840, partial [Rosa sericea]